MNDSNFIKACSYNRFSRSRFENFFKKVLPKRDDTCSLARSLDYTKIGNNVDVGQGCIYVGKPKEVLESWGFVICSPFIMQARNGKNVLGHIDVLTKPEEIVETIKTHFAPKEIENARFSYYSGPYCDEEEGHYRSCAVKTIENALKLLGVKGENKGVMPSGKIIVDSNGAGVSFDKPFVRKIFEENMIAQMTSLS